MPGPNWFHFREQQHSAGGWYKQEASHFHSDEEYFRRAINVTEQAWVRRWNSSNYNVSTGVFTPLLAVIGVGVMKLRGLRSSDLSDACVLTFATREWFDSWSKPEQPQGWSAGTVPEQPMDQFKDRRYERDFDDGGYSSSAGGWMI